MPSTEAQKKWYKENKERISRESKKKYASDRSRHLKYTYGITQDEYFEMYDKQEGRCAICKIFKSRDGSRFDRLHVDHCHVTGKIRELLCFTCNLALGNLKDNKELVMTAYEYLVRNQ